MTLPHEAVNSEQVRRDLGISPAAWRRMGPEGRQKAIERWEQWQEDVQKPKPTRAEIDELFG